MASISFLTRRAAARALLVAACGAGLAAHAGPLRAALDDDDGMDAAVAAAPLPASVRVLRDQPYGPHPRQRMDVYLPPHAHDAPVLFMVHGGAWRMGDKAHASVVHNKVARWVPQGVVLVSVNYRLLPEAGPLEQARDVARALAQAQRLAPQWGAAPGRFVAMGHSAGAHLVALLAAAPVLWQAQGAVPVRATVALDSAVYDVAEAMRRPHLHLYDAAFGSDPAQWAPVSPAQQLRQAGAPLLAVCSTRRRAACAQAEGFAAQARTLGMRVQVLGQDLTHGEINASLGREGPYTEAVEAFLRSVDAKMLP